MERKGNHGFKGRPLPPANWCGAFWKTDLLRPGSRQPGFVLRPGSGSERHGWRCLHGYRHIASPARHQRLWLGNYHYLVPFYELLTPRCKARPSRPTRGAGSCVPHPPQLPPKRQRVWASSVLSLMALCMAQPQFRHQPLDSEVLGASERPVGD